uniref:Helix-turn-helix domain-containing protein n=1 Tax=Trichobilharzia regenti TaxID=157069 RepID=A0AA85JPQ9_TRIRE|nr:unnamed protein product [Trichobilharzia regenti]
MSYVENLSLALISKVPFFYGRYVDDIILICEDHQDASRLLYRLNCSESYKPYTCEEEIRNQLAFLDILLSRRDDGSITRSIYRKPTWTGRYLSFHSFCPLQYKTVLVKCLFKRIQRICTADVIEKENEILMDTLLENRDIL